MLIIAEFARGTGVAEISNHIFVLAGIQTPTSRLTVQHANHYTIEHPNITRPQAECDVSKVTGPS